MFIHPDEEIEELGYDDLYQESSIALCKAAATYDGKSAQFSTYATTVIRNHLYNCCKKVNTRQRKLPSVSLDIDYFDDDQPPPFLEPSVPDGFDELLGRMDAAALLADCKRRYSGVARLGVEALELKVKGVSGADIARLYDAKPNQVGAWIARAAQKIRKDIVIWDKKQAQRRKGSYRANGGRSLFLFTGQCIHAHIQRHGDFVEGLHRKIVAGLIALYLADEIMEKPGHLRQLGRSHALFFPMFPDILPYCVINGLFHLFYKLHNIVWCTPNNITYFF